MPRPVERRSKERGEGAEAWSEDERKTLLKLGGLFEKYNNRHGKAKEPEKKEKSFLEELGISL